MFVAAVALCLTFVSANRSWAQHPAEWGFNQSRRFAVKTETVPEPKTIVPRLSGVDLEKLISSGAESVIVFLADWCEECRLMEDEIRFALDFINDLPHKNWKPPIVNFIDIDDNQQAFLDWSIDTLPKLIFFNNETDAELQDYTGPSRRIDVALWLRRLATGDRIAKVQTGEEWSLWTELGGEVAAIANCSDDDRSLLRILGQPPIDLPVLRLDGDDIVTGGDGSCSIIHRFAFEHPWSYHPLNNQLTWIEIVRAVQPIRLDASHIPRIFADTTPILLAVLPSNRDPPFYKAVREKLQDAVRLTSGNITSVMTGVETPFERRFMDYLGLSTLWDRHRETGMTFQPVSMLLMLTRGSTFSPKWHLGPLPKKARWLDFEGRSLADGRVAYLFNHTTETNDTNIDSLVPWDPMTLQEDHLKTFIDETLHGNAYPFIMKSDDRPFSLRETAVVDISARSLRRLMSDPESNVVLFMYTSWCVHCEKMRSIFQKTAERFSATQIAFASMNGDTNEMPAMRVSREDGTWEWRRLSVSAFPAVWALTSGNGIPLEYVGERTVASLVGFVAATFSK